MFDIKQVCIVCKTQKIRYFLYKNCLRERCDDPISAYVCDFKTSKSDCHSKLILVCYYVFMYMVCSSLGRLTKLRAYSFQFWFQVLPVARGRARVDLSAHTICDFDKVF